MLLMDVDLRGKTTTAAQRGLSFTSARSVCARCPAFSSSDSDSTPLGGAVGASDFGIEGYTSASAEL